MIVAFSTPLLLGGCLPMMGMMLMGGHDKEHGKSHDEQPKGPEKAPPDARTPGESGEGTGQPAAGQP